MASNTHPIDGWSIFTLVVFLVTNLIVIAPFRIPLSPVLLAKCRGLLVHARILSPLPAGQLNEKPYFMMDYSTAPVLSVLLLLATRCIGREEVYNGIVGSNGVEPYNIMCLFISLAYISIALDTTGLLRYLAFWVARRGGASGFRLYLSIYVLFLGYGILVGNDPVILSGTPFLAYLTRVTDLHPTAWIFAEFAACNMASLVLISSNPTNLVLVGAYSLSFVTYTANTILPFLASSVFVFPLLVLVVFKSSIPRTVQQPDVDPMSALVDKAGAVFGSILLITTLIVLVSTNASGLHVAVWQVTLPAGCLMLARDTAHDLSLWKLAMWIRPDHPSKSPEEDRNKPVDREDGRNDELQLSIMHEVQEPGQGSAELSPDASGGDVRRYRTVASSLSHFSHLLPTVSSVITRLPLPLLPFAFSMFTLVQGIGTTGWLQVFAGWWAAWASKTGPVGVVFGMGLASVVLCNFCGTNIGATILLATVLQTWTEQHQPPPRQNAGALYALAIGSNYGAFSTTFPASLAGLLWRGILRQKGIEVRTRDFAKINLRIIAVAMALGCTVLIGQLYVMY